MHEHKARRKFMKDLGKGLSALLLFEAVINTSACGGGEGDVGGVPMSVKPADITNELKERIGRDNPGTFNSAVWDQVRFGSYYGEEQELINIVVYETTDKVINKSGRSYMPTQVWKDLIASVKVDTLPKDAVNPMMDAAQRALPWDDEGPKAGRPPTRPTLRMAK